jgi:hypothetical protein
VAVLLARGVDPFVLELRQEVRLADLERVAQATILDGAGERPRVDPDVPRRTEPDVVARGEKMPLPRLAELAAQIQQRGAQASSSALVQDVGPEPRSHPGARLHALMERQPREQRPAPPTGGRDVLSVHLERQPAQQPQLQHRRPTLDTRSSSANRFDAALTAA